MGKSSKAALESDQRNADLTRASSAWVRRERRLNYESCAAMAEMCATGREAAEAIRASLHRSYDHLGKDE